MKIRIILALLIMVLMTGCQTALPMPDLPEVKKIKIESNEIGRRLAFAGGLFDIERGNVYVAYPYWRWSIPNVNVGYYVCNPLLKYRLSRSVGYWNEDDNILGDWPDETSTYIEKALANIGYNIEQHRKSYFEDRKRTSAELKLSMRITDLKFNMCHVYMPLSLQRIGRSGGEGYVRVVWELYDTIREKVIGEFETLGYGHVDEPLPKGEKAVFMRAVSDAVERLGNLSDFRRLVMNDNEAEIQSENVGEPLEIATGTKQFYKPIREQYHMVRKSVLAVKGAGERMGSGFFINREGYALTTASLIGDAEVVQVTDASGTKYKADVIRKSVRYNIALIKADIIDNYALPLDLNYRADPLEEVYAVGVPFSNSYKPTVTQGILNSNVYKYAKDISLLQPTLPITDGYQGAPLTDKYGNVIGIMMSNSNTDSETNFNLALPIYMISEALHLNLTREK